MVSESAEPLAEPLLHARARLVAGQSSWISGRRQRRGMPGAGPSAWPACATAAAATAPTDPACITRSGDADS